MFSFKNRCDNGVMQLLSLWHNAIVIINSCYQFTLFEIKMAEVQLKTILIK